MCCLSASASHRLLQPLIAAGCGKDADWWLTAPIFSTGFCAATIPLGSLPGTCPNVEYLHWTVGDACCRFCTGATAGSAGEPLAASRAISSRGICLSLSGQGTPTPTVAPSGDPTGGQMTGIRTCLLPELCGTASTDRTSTSPKEDISWMILSQ